MEVSERATMVSRLESSALGAQPQPQPQADHETGGGGGGGGGLIMEYSPSSSNSSSSRSPTPSPPPTSACAPTTTMNDNNNMTSSASEDLAMKKEEMARMKGMDLALTHFSPSSHLSLSPKRGRGRPRGSGRRQILATLGEWFALSAGGNFTPHVITIATGEDVAGRIFSFSQKGPRAICILSANGAISNVTLRQPGSSGGTLTYEGRFEILSLSGSFTMTENGGVRSRTGGLSVSLAGPDGRVVGGGVAGLLLAASPIQVVVGSFVPNTMKAYKRRAANHKQAARMSRNPASTDVLTAVRPISQATPDNDGDRTPTSTMMPAGQVHVSAEKKSTDNSEDQNPAPFRMVSWPGSLQSPDQQRPSPDINVCIQRDQ